MDIVFSLVRFKLVKSSLHILSIIALAIIPSALTFLSVTNTASAVAAGTCDDDFYSLNDIRFYRPCDPESVCGTGAAPAIGAVTNSSDNAEAIFKYLISTPFSTLGGKPMSAIQAAAVLGNMYGESSFDPGAIQSGQAYNEAKAMDPSVKGYGFGLVQWDLGRRVNLLNHAGGNWTDLMVQLDFLKTELEGSEATIMKDSEFATTSDVAAATVRWRTLFERTGSASDSKRIQAATDAFLKFKDLAPGVMATLSSGTVACSNTSGGAAVGANSGNIAATAIALSWSERASAGATDHTALQNKPEYTTALATTGVNKLGDSCSMGGNSCDAFVATVLRLSGVDPGFPCCGADSQNSYMQSNPSKYAVVSLSNLVAGDILWRTGHIKIYIGNGREAAASHCSRTAEQSTLFLNDGSYTAYRPQ